MGWLNRSAKGNLEKIYTERIEAFSMEQIGSGSNAELYAEAFELNEFKFLKLYVIWNMNLSTKEGCEVTFKGQGKTLEMDSDTEEIDTEFSATLRKGLAQFDLDLEDELVEMIESEAVESVTIKLKKSTVEIPVNRPDLLKESLVIKEEPEPDNDVEVEFEELEDETEASE